MSCKKETITSLIEIPLILILGSYGFDVSNIRVGRNKGTTVEILYNKDSKQLWCEFHGGGLMPRLSKVYEGEKDVTYSDESKEVIKSLTELKKHLYLNSVKT